MDVRSPSRSFCWVLLVVLSASPSVRAGETPAAKPIDFARDIQPILSDNCFKCHGPDANERQANLRLDLSEFALRAADSGKRAIIAGNAAQSELMRRVQSGDPDQQMPPPDSNRHLNAQQKSKLARWIDEGAVYKLHWAYVPPKRSSAPEVKRQNWIRGDIDRYILARIENRAMQASPEANRVTLIRRLSFDLLGLPPTAEEVTAFMNDTRSDAYERLVDRLLASPHYGERMAVMWLDLVRYADTNGYHADNHRNVFPFRDYVISSFNSNKPFDQFTVEQLAGDLLPNATNEQKVASGYNRMNMVTTEGGAQAKEYIAKYAADRVRNASEVWLAATLGCAQCHDHKFDPFATKDFYRFAAFFADLKQVGVYGAQFISLDPELRLSTSTQDAKLKKFDQQIAEASKKLYLASKEKNAVQEREKWERTLQDTLKKAAPNSVPAEITAATNIEKSKRTKEQQEAIDTYFRNTSPLLSPLKKALDTVVAQRKAYEEAIPHSLVAMSITPEQTRVLPRGNWQDESGALVQPGVPGLFTQISHSDARATRLELANWLVSKGNPLTARVFVNRVWKMLFGQGIVTTSEDFGVQGALPSHPELLDYLASEFMDHGWNIKRLVRQIVLSSTYRQSSLVSGQLAHGDPFNSLLARQGRFRLDAEFVRDDALAISGLLNPQIGGNSNKPYQPDGYWDHCNIFVGKLVYIQDHGPNLYRRGLYSYWKRTFLHPALLAFDAPNREECTANRPRSNTPLQALVLLNDPTFVEASRAFAERILTDGGATPEARLTYAFKRAVSRPPRGAEIDLLKALLKRSLDHYKSDKNAAEQLSHVGEKPVDAKLDLAELAAWTNVARAILNLHEAITRN